MTKDKSLYASSLGAGEFQKIIKSNGNLRVIVDNVNRLGLTEVDTKKIETILMTGSKEDIKILSDVILKSAEDGRRVSDFLDGKVSIIGDTQAESHFIGELELKPNTNYTVNGYNYKTDELGRRENTKGSLTLEDGVRNSEH